MRTARRLILAVAAVLALLAPTAADARKMGNPSPNATTYDFIAQVTGGYIQLVGQGNKINTFSLDFGAIEGSLITNPWIQASVTSDGTVTVPPANVRFPDLPLVIPGTGAVTIQFQSAGTWTGNVDPLTGKVALVAKLKVKIIGQGSLNGLLGNNCYVGSDSNPLLLDASTHTGDNLRVSTFQPSDSNGGGPMTGQGYTDELGLQWPDAPGLTPSLVGRLPGSFRVANQTFTAPASSGCGSGVTAGPAAEAIDGALGLPANTVGANAAVLDLAFTNNLNISSSNPDVDGVPLPGAPTNLRTGDNVRPQKGVRARVVAPGLSNNPWPSTQVPQLPTGVPTDLDASSSVFSAGPNPGGRYRWDIGTGTFDAFTDTATQSGIVFNTPGDRVIRVQARDADGDVDTIARTIKVVQSPDISIDTATTTPEFRAGSPGTYRLTVTNTNALQANTQPITVVDTLPAGVTYTGVTAPGWNCTEAAGTVTCVRPTGTLAGSASSTIDIATDVAASAPGSLSNTATATMAGDPTAANNSSTAVTTVRKTDLTITKTHTGEAQTGGDFTANGTYDYTLDVENVGDAATSGATTVTDTLPAGLEYRPAGSGGTGWSCPATPGPGPISCTYSGSIAAGAHAAPLTLKVKVANSTEGDVLNAASVSTQADVDAFGGSNDATDTVTVVRRADLSISSSHSGAFVVGDPGTYTLTVSNESLADATDPTTVSYDLPAGLTVDAVPTGTGWDCSATVVDSDRVDCSYAGTIAAGANADALTLSVDVTHAAYPSATHSPAVSNDLDGYAGNDSSDDVTAVRRLDLSMTKSALRSFSVGIEGVYRLTVSNVGDADTVGPITVVDELPGSLHLRSVSGAGWDCSASTVGGQLVSCVRSAPLAFGTSASQITVRVDVLDEATEGDGVVNTATVDTPRDDRGVAADAPITANNTSTITTPAVSVDVSVEATHADPFRVGEDNVYALKVKNVGAVPTVPGESVTVTDVLPAGVIADTDNITINRPGWDCGTTDQTVTCTLEAPSPTDSAMEVGDTVSIEIPVSVTDAAPESADNVATVSTLKDSDIGRSPNNQSVDPTNIHRIDLAVTTSVSIPPRAGGIGEITVGTANNGTHATVAPTHLAVSLPTGVSYRPTGSTVTGWSCAAGGPGIECVHNASIPADTDAETLKLRTDVTTGAPDDVTGTTELTTAGEPATRLGDNDGEYDAELQKVDLALSKSHNVDGFRPDTHGAFELVVWNEGNVTSTGTIRVVDDIDPDFGTPRASGSGWNCTVTGNHVECTRTTPLGADDGTPPIRITAKVPHDLAGTHESQPLAHVVNAGDPYTGNNAAADPVTVIGVGDLSLTADWPMLITVGETATLRYKIKNTGGEPVVGSPSLKLHDDLPEGLTPLSFQSSDNVECELAEGALDCKLFGPVDPGKTVTVDLVVRVGRSAAPGVSSLSTVTATQNGADLNPFNDFSAGISFVSETNLAIAAEAKQASIKVGEIGAFQVDVTNTGDYPSSGPINVTYPLADGVKFVDVGVNGWTCRLVVRTVDCESNNAAGPVGSGFEDLPPLTIRVRPAESNVPTLRSTFTVATAGDLDVSNDSVTRSDTIVTAIVPPAQTPQNEAPPAVNGGGPFGARLKTGALKLGSLDPLALTADQLVINGAVGSDGTLSIPTTGVVFKTIAAPVNLGGSALDVKIILSATGPGSGSLPAGGGPARLVVPVQAKVEAYLGGSPLLGTTSNCILGPITFDLSGNYDAGAKTLTVGSQSVGLPVAGDGCGALGGQVNQLLGLPSSTNSISLTFDIGNSPVVPPADSPGDSTPPTPIAPGALAFGRLSSKITSNALSVPVKCNGQAGAKTCSGELRLTAKVKSGKKTKTVTLAKLKYGVGAGKTKTYKLKLPASARKYIGKAGRKGLKSTVAIWPAGAKKAAVSKALVLKLPATKKK